MLQICLYVKGCQVIQLFKNANINTTISFVHNNICQKDHQTIIKTMIITITITLPNTHTLQLSQQSWPGLVLPGPGLAAQLPDVCEELEVSLP